MMNKAIRTNSKQEKAKAKNQPGDRVKSLPALSGREG